MNRYFRHSWTSLSLLLTLLLLMACSSGGDESRPKPTLSIYIYAPNSPVVTRSDVTSEGTTEENTIKKLQIWIFKTGQEDLIGYLELQGDQLANLNSAQHHEVYRMEIDEAFASQPSDKRSKVDVYVLANVSVENCGDSKGESTHRATPTEGSLETTHIAPKYFCPAQSETVATYGVPMSDVLYGVEVAGESPVLKITTAKLKRRVSKIRFVFSSLTGKGAVTVTGVELDENLIPDLEYLFQDETQYYSTYKPGRTMLLENMPVKSNDAPYDYAYDEDRGDIVGFVQKIDQGVKDGLLSDRSVYLRATDKKLAGNIYYKVGSDVTQRKVRFEMTKAGDFVRNSTWIIYGYFRAEQLEVETVDVTPWKDMGSDEHEVYNW